MNVKNLCSATVITSVITIQRQFNSNIYCEELCFKHRTFNGSTVSQFLTEV